MGRPPRIPPCGRHSWWLAKVARGDSGKFRNHRPKRTFLPCAQVELPDLEQGVLAIGQQELLIFADLNIHDLIAVRGERHDLGRGSECGDRHAMTNATSASSDYTLASPGRPDPDCRDFRAVASAGCHLQRILGNIPPVAALR